MEMLDTAKPSTYSTTNEAKHTHFGHGVTLQEKLLIGCIRPTEWDKTDTFSSSILVFLRLWGYLHINLTTFHHIMEIKQGLISSLSHIYTTQIVNFERGFTSSKALLEPIKSPLGVWNTHENAYVPSIAAAAKCCFLFIQNLSCNLLFFTIWNRIAFCLLFNLAIPYSKRGILTFWRTLFIPEL